jgi:anti-sigma B factor antagonist
MSRPGTSGWLVLHLSSVKPVRLHIRFGGPVMLPGHVPDHDQSVITLPTEIDAANAGQVTDQLKAAAAAGPPLLIADMTFTTFIDSSGIRAVLRVCQQARRSGTELRLVVPSAQVLRTLAITGVDRLLPIYPSVGAALTAPPADGQHPAR